MLSLCGGLLGWGGPGRQTWGRRWLAAATVCAGGCGTVAVVRGPGQPHSGPGGADYKHTALHAQRFGEGVDEYWVFSPDDPRPEEAPCVVFLHGWGALHPRTYGAWIQHLVRKGRIVIYPRYQYADKLRTPGDVMLDGARGAVKAAWSRLNESGPVRPIQDRIAWFGHSFGGVLAAKLAASSVADGLPPPAVLLLIEPGSEGLVGLGDLNTLPPDTLVELVVGDADTLAGDTGARAIVAALTVYTPLQRGGSGGSDRRIELVRIRSDRRSNPPLIADHFAPLGAAPDFPPQPIEGGDMHLPGGPLRDRIRERRIEQYSVDAIDFYGFWKLGDALLGAVFEQKDLEFGFGDTPQQRFMGVLSNGEPVIPLEVERAK